MLTLSSMENLIVKCIRKSGSYCRVSVSVLYRHLPRGAVGWYVVCG